jgi:hypothetical protein
MGAVMATLWLSFWSETWVAVVLGLVLFCVVLWVEHRYIPLSRISRREVTFHRVFSLVAIVAVALWLTYLVFVDHVS